MPNEIKLPEPKHAEEDVLFALAEELYPVVNGLCRAILDGDDVAAWRYSQELRKIQERHDGKHPN